uniref:Uncharacterized protein n=1 Tax=Globodera pallida TaxID=36090 RepID=A0A183CCD3_GLOPA
MNDVPPPSISAATSGGWTDESEREQALVGVTGAREAARVTIHYSTHAPKRSRVSTTDEAHSVLKCGFCSARGMG